MSNHRYAVDIVLLPDPTIEKFAIEANRVLVAEHAETIVLGRGENEAHPHVSLATGAMEKTDLDSLIDDLEEMIENGPGAIPISGFKEVEHDHHESTCWILLENTIALQSYHEKIMELSEKYLHHDATVDEIHPSATPQGAQESVDFVNEFRERFAFEGFVPHMTIGHGRLGRRSIPPIFTAWSLAIAHVGGHGTCRDILWHAEYPRED